MIVWEWRESSVHRDAQKAPTFVRLYPRNIGYYDDRDALKL